MAVTLPELRTRIRYFIRDPNANGVPNAEIDVYINDAQIEVAAFLSKQGGDFLLREATATLVQAQTDYNYPSDIFGRNIRALWAYTTGSFVYRKVGLGTLEEVYALGTVQQDYPEKYACLDGYFKIGPPPNASGYTLRISYIRQPTTLTADEDTMDLDDEMKELVCVCAAIRVIGPRGGKETLEMLMASKLELMAEADRLISKEDTIQAFPAWKY